MKTLSKSKNFLLALILPVVFMSCKNQDWNETAPLELKLENIELNDEFSFNSGNIEVDSVAFTIDDILVKGSRLQAEKIEIGATLSNITDLFSTGATSVFMDIPQGSYSEMELYFLSTVTENFSMFLHYDHPGQGQGLNNKDKDVNVTFDLSEVGPLPIFNLDGGRQHLITKENSYQLAIKMNIDVLFEDVNLASWNGMINSQNNQGQGQGVVTINENVNENIQEQLIENINKAFEISLYSTE